MSEECLTYLRGRGIDETLVQKYRYGYVGDPAFGHERYRGMLAIPYIKKRATVGIKFRCIHSHVCKQFGHAKYLMDGGVWLYNSSAVDEDTDVLGICEGEIDTGVVSAHIIPSVGIPGVSVWKSLLHSVEFLKEFRRIILFCHNDSGKEKNVGRELGNEIRKTLTRADIVEFPEGMDGNETFLAYGADKIKELAGL